MKARKISAEIICFALLLYWFYEGIYKVANWTTFSMYIKNAPLVKPMWQILAYGIPIGEIILALMFLFPSKRVRALYITMGALVLFVLWIMSVFLFTGYLLWPFNAFWPKPTWMQKMLLSLGMCWGAFMVVVSMGIKISFSGLGKNALPNKTINTQQ